MRSCRALSLAVLSVAIGAMPCRAGDIMGYLATDGTLKEKLTLRISSGGGGFSGYIRKTVWSIEPSGVWTRGTSEGYNATPGPIVGTVRGQLTKHRLAALAQHLAAQDFKALPDRMSFGRQPDVQTGAYSVEITFGKKSARLTTVGGLTDSGPKAGDPKADEWSRFVALTLVLQDMLKEDAADPKKPGQPDK